MPATIQTIQKPTRARALDTSGNNNHGQIYSGRGLEFDGVGDYLTTTMPSMDEKSSITISCWAKIDTAPGGDEYIVELPEASVGTNGCGIAVDANQFRFDIVTHSDSTVGDDSVTYTYELNTWYRLTLTYDGVTAKAYINGVLVDSDTVTVGTGIKHSSSEITVGNFGASAASGYEFGGKISDVQVWDAAFSADDVLYDYLNPEQLALNRGGTSLTESNLKVWYPMQDGHRGQQSFILDGSNTGLGDEMITDGDFSTDSGVWTNESGWEISSGVATKNSGVSNYLHQDFTGNGVFKITWEVSNYVSGSVKLRVGSGFGQNRDSDTFSSSTGGTFTEYLSKDTGSFGIYGTGEFSIDNISVKPVNAKNHATTVFYGDELHTLATCTSTTNETDATTGWTNAGFATFASDTEGNEPTAQGTHSLHLISDGAGDYCKLASAITLVIGRTYKVITTFFGGDTGDEFQIRFSTIDADGTAYGANTLSTAAWTTAETTFTAIGTSLYVRIYEGSSDNVGEIYIGSMSVKEVGTATGWTDADQQLDIPQTALQSYNQLAWFTGNNDHISCGSTSSPELGTGGWSVSGWFNSNYSESTDNYNTVFAKWKSPGIGFFVRIQTSDGQLSMQVASDASNRFADSSLTVTEGRWYHYVITYSGVSTEKVNIYMDGENVVADKGMTSGSTPGYAEADDEFAIGGGYTGTSENFCGAITEVSTYSSALTQAQVITLYNDGKAYDVEQNTALWTACTSYWRNNGLSTWTDRKSTNHGTTNNVTETLLLPAGVDSSRDNQGFLMNRQKDTNALNLSEFDDYTDCGDLSGVDSASTLTMSCWINVDNTADDNPILSKFKDTDNRAHIYVSGNVLYFNVSAGEARWGQVAFIATGWHYVVMVFDGSGTGNAGRLKGYVNGVAQTLTFPQEDIGTTLGNMDSNTLMVGRQDTSYMAGIVDDVAVYTTALSQPEITRNYNAGKRSHRNG